MRAAIRRTASPLLGLAMICTLQAHGAEGTDPGNCETLRTYNATGNKIWITVYDVGKTSHLDYGWVDACSVRAWRSGNYACGSYYHVRAQVKPYDVNGPDVFDTNIETNPQGSNYTSQGVTLRRSGASNNYYWEHGNTAGCTPNGLTNCCDSSFLEPQGSPVHYDPPPPRPPDQVQFTFDNTTKFHALVVPYIGIPASVGDNVVFGAVCVPPESKKTWTLTGYWEYRVRATPRGKDCSDPNPHTTYVGVTKTVNGAAVIKFAHDPKTRYFTFPP